MNDKVVLIQQIKFGIAQLGPQNRFMDFEHICRFFSRARIHLNILPATGPVQAGGDQGKDFETFFSYFKNDPFLESVSIGSFSNKPVVFLCSLEKNPTAKNGKIDKDLAKIFSSNANIERVYFFSGEDIAIGKRNKKIQEVKNEYNSELQIIDATALSEHLSDPDLYWLAIRYLNLSSDFYPIIENEEWYTSLVQEYKTRILSYTIEEFLDVKLALRHIYKNALMKVDLPFWLEKLDFYLLNDCPVYIKRRAIYEKFVIKFMGQNDVSELESITMVYFDDQAEYLDSASLKDATILIGFVRNAISYFGFNLPNNKFQVYKNKLWKTLNNEFNLTIDPNKKCILIELQAQFMLGMAKGGPKAKDEIIKAFKHLTKLFDFLEEAPLYPLDDISKNLTEYLKLFLQTGLDTSIIEDISARIDKYLGVRYGEIRIGESLKNRAAEYINVKNYTKALELLHEVKMSWYTEEMLENYMFILLIISDCYQNISLDYASKYYALAAGHCALNSSNINYLNIFPKAIDLAAEADYSSGSWASYFELVAISLNFYTVTNKDFSIYDSKEYYRFVLYPAIILNFNEKFDIGVEKYISAKIENWGYVKDDIIEVVETIIKKGGYEIDTVTAQLTGIPFNDFGEKRILIFKVLNSDWKIEFKNDYDTNSIAEQFVAILQILLLEFKDEDLLLIKSDVNIRISVNDEANPNFEEMSSNEQIIWNVKFPIFNKGSYEDLMQTQSFYGALTYSILRNLSLLEDKKFSYIFSSRMKSSILISKVFIGVSYEYLYRNYFSKEHFSDCQSYSIKTELHKYSYLLKECENLTLPQNVFPGYNKMEVNATIKRRLAHKKILNITLPKLKESTHFMNVVYKLREKGWLDWQIYLAVGNRILNFKIRKIDPIYESESANIKAHFHKYFFMEESEWYIQIDPTMLTEDVLMNDLETIIPLTVIPSYGLYNYSTTPNFVGILDFLIHRASYLTEGALIKIF